MGLRLLFKESSYQGLKFSALVLLSLVLMTMDYRGLYTQPVRRGLSAVVAPIQYAVSWPVELFDWVTDNVSLQQKLIEENANLRAQAMMLQGRLQQVLSLQKENSQLRGLLQSTARRKESFTIAQMLAVSTEPYVARIIIDQGNRSRVYLGQPVLDARGVMGQITQVGPLTSQVMLITDVNSAIPVQVYRTGMRAIAVGTGSMRDLSLLSVSDRADIQPGDLVTTSGLGLRYPEGYPVGIVTQVERKAGQHIAQVAIQPSARLLQSRQVLLVWQKSNQQRSAMREEVSSAETAAPDVKS